MRLPVAGLLVILSAAGCGGGEPSDGFVGLYMGTGGESWGVGPQSPPPGSTVGPSVGAAVYVRIVRLDASSVVISGMCSGLSSDGPAAAVTGPSSLEAFIYYCARPAPPGCEASDSFLRIDGGTATLTNGTLSLNLTASLTECGYTWPGTFTFEGTRSTIR